MGEYHHGHMSKEELQDNALLSILVKIRHSLFKNKKLVYGVGAGVLVILAVIIIMAINSSSAEKQASIEFDKVLVLLQAENARENVGDIDKKLDEIVKKWPDTLAGAKAALHLANLQFKLDNFTGAIENFLKVVAYSKSGYLYPAALIGIGNCHEQSGDLVKAIEYYDVVGQLVEHYGFRDMARLGKARILGAQGKIDEARKALEGLRSDVSSFADEAMRLSIWLDSKKTVQVIPAGK